MLTLWIGGGRDEEERYVRYIYLCVCVFVYVCVCVCVCVCVWEEEKVDTSDGSVAALDGR